MGNGDVGNGDVHKYINKKYRYKAQGIRYMGKESVKQMGQGLTDQGLMVFRWSASAELR
jgi:hypothetical protein